MINGKTEGQFPKQPLFLVWKNNSESQNERNLFIYQGDDNAPQFYRIDGNEEHVVRVNQVNFFQNMLN